jgi:hypothetical protein
MTQPPTPTPAETPKTCATCGWWGEQRRPNRAERRCDRAGYTFNNAPGPLVLTGPAFLLTGAEFGCTLHEVK